MKQWKIGGKLEYIAGATGFALMAYELVAARVLAPSIGSSTYIWTSVIGVIIAALSFGYYAGGRVADARSRMLDIVWLLLLAALGVALTRLTYLPVLDWVVTLSDDPRVQGVMASLVLFAPTSFVLGMISPYLAKQNVRSLAGSGRAVASLSTWNAIGSIAGTFVTGFILFGLIGSQQTFGVVVALLVLAAWLLVPRARWQRRIILSAGLLMLACLPVLPKPSGAESVAIDTPASHYEIMKGEYGGEPIVALATGPRGLQSGVYQDGSKRLAFWYTQEMARLALAEKPQRMLMLGGGTFTIPRYLAEKLPEAQIDVVEIDPALQRVAEEYFHYDNPPHVRLVFDDARRYLETTTERYDVVLVDVYSESHVPFTLITREYGDTLERVVQEGGAVIVNGIGALSPGHACQPVLAAQDAAYRQHFPHARYSTQQPQLGRGNYVLRYTRQPSPTRGQQPLAPLGSPLYTDNFTPSERLQFRCLQA